MKRRILLVVSILLVFIGLAMLIAPRVSNQVGKQIAHSTIEDFKSLKSESTTDEVTDEMPSEENTTNQNSQKNSSFVSHIDDETELTEQYNGQTVKPDFTRLYMDSVIYNEALKQHQTELLINEQAYYVQEYATDKHYIIDNKKYPFEFAYTGDMEVQHFDISGDKEFVNELKRGTVYTTKVDEEYPDNKLQGAKFEIYADVDGDKTYNAEVDTLVGEMNESPVKAGDYYLNNLPAGGYFLYEKEAPKGFEKDDNYYYFEIVEDDDIVTVENKAGVGFINKPSTGEIEITKKDVATGKPLPKAGFRIKDADGKVVAEGYTDENGVAKFKLRAGKYTYEEFDAPEGYIIDTTPHEFEITENGQIIKAEMTNEKETPPTTPQTGDSNMTGFFIGLGALALGGIVACAILFLKKKKDDGDDE